jgi:RHS repeat-associated protein
LGHPLHDYIYFGGKRIARQDGSGATTVYYYFQDHLGTGLMTVDVWGHVQQQSVYYPFGGERVITNNVANDYKFTGLERDSETGLDHTLNRQYSSTLGRWLSPDPVKGRAADPQSLNLYPYVGDNPTDLVDPSGECGCDAFSGVDCGCDPSDPFCGGGFGGFPQFGFGTITVNFNCPDNKSSCCSYYDNLARWPNACALERQYAHFAKYACETLTGADCLENCVRSCLVSYSQAKCGKIPDCVSRVRCREFSADYACALDCAFWALIPGGLGGNAHLTIPVPAPVDISVTVTIAYPCSCTDVGGCI